MRYLTGNVILNWLHAAYTVIPPRARPPRARTPLVHGFWAKIFTPQLFSTTSVLCHFAIVLLLLLRFFTNNISSGCKQKQFDACSSVVNYYFGIFYCSYQYFSIYWEYWNSPLVHGPPSCSTVFGHFLYPRRPCTRGDDCITYFSLSWYILEQLNTFKFIYFLNPR